MNMIPHPKCQISNQNCHLCCINEDCEISPFICNHCEDKSCFNLHLHNPKAKMEIKYWNEIVSAIQHFSPLPVQLRKQQQQLHQTQSHQRRNFKQMINHLKDKKYANITGQAMRIFYNQIQNLQKQQQQATIYLYLESQINKKETIEKKQQINKQILAIEHQINLKNLVSKIQGQNENTYEYFQIQLLKNMDDDYEIYENLIHLIKQMDYEYLFIDKYTHAISKNPNNFLWYYLRGCLLDFTYNYSKALLFQLQQLQLTNKTNEEIQLNGQQPSNDAILDFNKSIQLNPSFFLAYYSRALLDQELQQLDNALNDYNKVIELNPKYYLAYYGRAKLYDNNGSPYSQVLQDYTKVIELNPNYYLAYFNRGVLNYNKNKFQEALEDFNKAISIQNFPEIYYWRAMVYSSLNQIELELKDYDKVIELNNKFQQAYENRAIIYQNKHQIKKAIQNYTKVLEINPKNYHALFNRGVLRSQQKQYELAAQDFTRAIELNPMQAEAYFNRALAYQLHVSLYNHKTKIYFLSNKLNYFKKSDLIQKAQRDYKIAILLNPKDYKAYLNQAGINLQNKDHFAWSTLIQKCIQINPNHFRTYYNRGLFFQQIGENQLAFQNYTKSIELNPQYPKAYYNRAILYKKNKKYKEAILDYTKNIELEPTFAQAYYNRAILKFKLTDYESAQYDFTEYLQRKQKSQSTKKSFFYLGQISLFTKNFLQAFTYLSIYITISLAIYHDSYKQYLYRAITSGYLQNHQAADADLNQIFIQRVDILGFNPIMMLKEMYKIERKINQ